MQRSNNRARRAESRLHGAILPLTAASLVALSTSLAAAVDVRTQPNGGTPSTAYGLVGESRDYFGHAVDATSGTYSCTWSIDGVAGAPFVPGDNTYISTLQSFASSGLHTLTLRCEDGSDPAENDQSTIEVLVQSADSDLRKKNSAIDKGLRYSYTHQVKTTGCFNGSGSTAASTGMALLAMENHGHNLDADSEDIYRWSVEKGLQCLYDNSATVDLDDQLCIGDPESDDGDTETDGLGINFAPGASQYYSPFAILAIVNATDATTAAGITPTTTTGSSLIDGTNSLVDIIRDARDYLAWSMTDLEDPSGGEGGSGSAISCSVDDGLGNTVGYFAGVPAGAETTFDGYVDLEYYTGVPGAECATTDPKDWAIDFGDSSSSGPVEANCGVDQYGGIVRPDLALIDFAPAGGDNGSWLGNPTQSYDYGGQIDHSFTAAGLYTVEASFNGTAVCSIEIEAPGPDLTCLGNGWRYSENDTSIDNSVAQWPTLALYEALDRWGIDSKPEVKDQLELWLDYSQDAGGSYGYSSPGNWLNTAKAGAGLIMRHFTGHALADAENQSSIGFIEQDWANSGVGDTYGNKGSFYAMYAVFKGLKLYGETQLEVPFGSGTLIDWEQDYNDWLVANQLSDGSWNTESWMDDIMTTYFGVAMLAPEVAGLPPVAEAGGPYGPVNALQSFALDGSDSFHQDPAKQLIAYQWDFDASDGLWWTTQPAPGAGEGTTGETPTHPGYPDLGADANYTITLRVLDNGTPQEADTDTASVQVTTGNVPPVAATNGPWADVPSLDPACDPADPAAVNNALCHPVTFDASASYDPNAGPPLNDSIVAYEWDLDGDGVYNEGNGEDGWPQGTPGTVDEWKVVKKLYQNPSSGLATLRVTDSFGLQDSASDEFVSIAFVFAENYGYCYTQRIGRTVTQKGVVVTFQNVGDGAAENVEMTLTDAPANVTVVKGVADLGEMGPGLSEDTACGGALGNSEIVWNVNLRASTTGEWGWKAEFDHNGTHYVIPNLPAVAP